jgi:hypothetical protein
MASLLPRRPDLADEKTSPGEPGNERPACIVLPKVPHARSEPHLPIQTRDRDFTQRARLEQKSLDVPVILGSRHGLKTSGASVFGTILLRDSAQSALVQAGTPSSGSSHCLKITSATRNATPQDQTGTV